MDKLDEDIKPETITTSDLQNFCDSLFTSFDVKSNFTMDFFDTNFGVVMSKETPSSVEFCAAALREILHHVKPSQQIWDKVKYMTFILNLATRNIDFNILYTIFHQVEQEVESRHLEWREDTVKSMFEDEIVEKLVVKTDLTKEPDDFDASKFGYEYDYLQDNEEDYENDDNIFDEDFDPTMLEPLAQPEVKYNIPEDKPKRKYTKRKKERLKNNDSIRVKDENDVDEEVIADPIVGNPLDPEFNQVKVNNLNEKRKVKKKPGPKPKPASERKQKILICQLCGYRGKYQMDYDKHSFDVHNITKLCSQCGYMSKTYEEWRDHDKTHTVTCEICDQKFLGKKSHMYHMTTVHKASEEEKVPCDVCGVFLKAQSLKMHLKQVHGGERFSCDMCDHVTNTKYLLTEHKQIHTRKMSKCPECGKMVKFLERHFKRKCSQQAKQRINCDLCDKTFSLKQGLKRHMKNVHQRISDYHCAICNYQTQDGFNLKVHVSTKHNKEQFWKICTICNKKTGNMDYHMKTYHYEEYIQKPKDEDHAQTQEHEKPMCFTSDQNLALENPSIPLSNV